MATKVKARILPDGCGAFMEPPGHPMHRLHVETFHANGRRRDDYLSLDFAAGPEGVAYGIDGLIRGRARRLLESYQPPAINSREAQLWIRRVMAYFNNCYRGDDPNPWHANRLHIHSNLCDAAHPIEDHAGVRFIRQYYPDFTPAGEAIDCTTCSHHLNAHANGEGGTCTVILDMDGYKAANTEADKPLCRCPSFIYEEDN